MIPRTFNVLFFLKKSKTDPNGPSHLYCRITINGVQTEISLGAEAGGLSNEESEKIYNAVPCTPYS